MGASRVTVSKVEKQSHRNDTFENKSIIEKIDNYFKDIKKQNREFLKVDVEGEVVLDIIKTD